MKNLVSNNSVYETTIKLLILLGLIVWCSMILMPFVNILLWSLIFAMAVYPLHTKLTQKLKGKRKLASFIIVISVLAVVFIPTAFLIDSFLEELKELKTGFESDSLTIPAPNEKIKEWPLVGDKLFNLWNSASINFEETVLTYKEELKNFGSELLKGTLSSMSALIQIVVSFIIAGVLLVFGGIGESIRKFFRKLVGSKGDEYADVTMKTVNSVVKGVLGVAFIVAIILGILFMLAGIPYAGVWALIVFVLGILQLPAILVTLPIIVYLFAVKSTTVAIIWTVLMIAGGLSDNILKPVLLGKGAPVPMLIIFIGVIGGFILSGFIGLFTGAIVMSIGYLLFKGWMNSDEEVKVE